VANPALNIEARRANSLPTAFYRYRSAIVAALRESLADDDLPMHQMLRYSMGWSDVHGNPAEGAEGKALRPTLCLLACEATGGNVESALPAAVSLELIHNFSLIHDDIQDRDVTRHHRPTLWAVWGEPKALVAGNALRVIADRCLGRLVEEGVSFHVALEVQGILTAAYLEMIEGQYLDLQYEGQSDIGLQSYLDMISRKTGALIKCALVLGSLIGSRDPAIVRSFGECGRSLGMVFQIMDDVLGVWGDEESTGKPVGADIRRKKNTFPVVYAMSRARGKDKEALLDIYRMPSVGDEEVAVALEVMENVGARQYAQSLASEHCEQALDALSTVELGPLALEDFRNVANFLLVREY
jgi:geranylgeranyl diphosphate synthase type I